MLGAIDLFNNPLQLPALGRPLHDDFLSEIGPPALLTLPLGDERAYNWGTADATGALNGGITTTASGFGTLGQAWNLNGTTGGIDVGTAASAQLQAPMSFWVLCKSSTAARVPFEFGKSTEDALQIYIPATGSIRVAIAAVNHTFTGANAVNGNPHLIFVSWDGSTLTCYLDGNVYGTPTAATGTINYAGCKLYLGYDGPNGFFWNGLIYAAGIHAGAFTAAQVSALYNCLLTGKPFPLFAPQVSDLAFGSAAAPTGGLLLRRRRMAA